MMKKIQSKKIQSKKNQSQKLLLAKNYIEQELESNGYKGHIRYDHTNKALIQFRIKEGTVAILKEGKLSIFKMPIKKFHDSLPLEFESVQIDSIQTQKATCCKKCHTWKLQASITRCTCGGYLVSRKRFHTRPVESWDAEFLEIQFARKDIAAATKTDRILSRRPKQYHTTGITRKLAGMSSILPENKIETVTRVSVTGAMWTEKWDDSTLAESATIRKLDGFAIPSTEDVQCTIKKHLCKKFSNEVSN